MPKLRKSDFAHRSDKVAKDLLGRYLVVNYPEEVIEARLREIAAYEGLEKRTSKGVLYPPGLLSISSKFGQCLLDISTGKEGKPSCVTIRAVDLIVEDKNLEDRIATINGPGNVAYALWIDKATRDSFEGAPVYGNKIYIKGNAVDKSQIKVLKGNAPNCLGIYRLIED